MTRSDLILAAALTAAIVLPGCAGMGAVQPAKAQGRLDSPASKPSGTRSLSMAGMTSIAPHIYVDRAMPRENIPRLLNTVEKARVRTTYFYGELLAGPDILFCSTMECYRKFGAIGLGYTLGNTILISPYGARAAIVSHELSHVELATRLGGPDIMDKVPQWFDEGIAVTVSLAHEFSDDAWLEACHNGESSPRLSELESMESWARITGANGVNMQRSYGTARQEVIRWYAKAGRQGLDQLVQALKANANFHDAYRSIEEENSAAVMLAARN